MQFERLERREVCAGDLDLTVLDVRDFEALAGHSVAVDLAVANRNDSAASAAYQVELRLSVDATIDDSDRLLEVIARGSLLPAATDAWTEQTPIPADVAHGRYYVGAVIRTAGTTTPGDVLADPQFVTVFRESLTGSVTYGGRAASVSIHAFRADGAPIRDDVPTWLVIHGRNSSPDSTTLVQLETSLDAVQRGDQVLVLDWSAAAASGAIGGAGENYIKPVATWAAGALSAYGISGLELNVVGHSWGAYVGAELAERMPAAKGQPGRVNSLVAIDPALDFPGGSYNPTARGEVNFARNSLFSWSFYAAGGGFGSPVTAATAREATLVVGADHFKIVQVVADLTTLASLPLASPTSLGAQFSFDRLLVTQLPNTSWRPNSYDVRARKVRSAPFEAVLFATADGTQVASLRFATMTGETTLAR